MDRMRVKGGGLMATAATQIRIDADTKRQAAALFSQLGLDMSGAVNLFLRQCVLRGGLPFAVEMPRYNQEALAAMEEGRRIARDPSVKGYTNMADLKKALEQEEHVPCQIHFSIQEKLQADAKTWVRRLTFG